MRHEGALATVIAVSSDPPFEGPFRRPIPAALIERQWLAVAALVGVATLTFGLHGLGRPTPSFSSPDSRSQ